MLLSDVHRLFTIQKNLTDMVQHLTYAEYEKQSDTLILRCGCGWKGPAEDAYNELHADVLDFECPKCDRMLLIVNLRRES